MCCVEAKTSESGEDLLATKPQLASPFVFVHARLHREPLVRCSSQKVAPNPLGQNPEGSRGLPEFFLKHGFWEARREPQSSGELCGTPELREIWEHSNLRRPSLRAMPRPERFVGGSGSGAVGGRWAADS